MTTLKSLKLNTVVDSMNMNASLIRGAIAWHGTWSDFKEIASDISKYGANTGISFIYYVDSVKFFRNHAPAIKEWLQYIANDLYGDSVSGMLTQWQSLKCYSEDEILNALYCGKGDAVDQVFDCAVKAVVEEIANTIVNIVDSE